MTGDKTLVMVKGPSCLAVNLGLERVCFRCRPSSHTFNPFLKGWKERQVLLFIVCLARSSRLCELRQVESKMRN